MRTLKWFCLALILGSLGTCIWTDRQLQHYEEAARSAERQRAIWQARFAEASTDVDTVTRTVVKWATRYDTVRAAMDSVITDTVTTVPAYWVKGLIVASDSTIAACRDLVNSCERLRVAADSSIHALGLERDAYKKAYQAAKPSRLQKALPWIAGAAGFYVGAKLRVP